MYKKDFCLLNQQKASSVLSNSAKEVFITLCDSEELFSRTSLANKLGKSEGTIQRAVREIKGHDLWLVQFQVLYDKSVKNSIYKNTTNNTTTIYPTGRNKARVVRAKEYIISLLTRDEGYLRFYCNHKGFVVNETTSKQTLIDVLNPYMIKFINHFDKPGSSFLKVTDKQMINHFKYWLPTHVLGKRRKVSKQDELVLEMEQWIANQKINPIDEIAACTELLAEVFRVKHRDNSKGDSSENN